MDGYGQRSPYSYGRYMPEGYGAYDPYSKYPNLGQWAQMMMQNYMAMREMKQQREQREWQRRMTEEQAQRQKEELGLEERKVTVLEKKAEIPEVSAFQEKVNSYLKAHPQATLGEALNWVTKYEPPKTPEEWEKEAEARARGAGTGKFAPEKPREPSAYERRKADLDKALTEQRITPAQYNQSLFNLRQEITPEEQIRKGDIIRQRNQKEVNDFYKDLTKDGRLDTGKVRNLVEDTKGQIPVSPQGYRLDMPIRYNVAKLNQQEEAATTKDLEIIAIYDKMFTNFQENQTKYPTYEAWITKSPNANDPDIDRNQMKIWYEIYGQKKKFLGIIG